MMTSMMPRNVIKKQKPRASKVYPEIIHKNTNNNNTESIAGAFADYFYELYQPNKDDIFDTSALENIKRLYSEITNECNDKPNQLPGGVITENEIRTIIKQLKRRKAGSHDNIQNEYLIFGGDKVVKCVTTLFDIIIKQEIIPNDWKKCPIVPIYKGNDKPKT